MTLSAGAQHTIKQLHDAMVALQQIDRSTDGRYADVLGPMVDLTAHLADRVEADDETGTG